MKQTQRLTLTAMFCVLGVLIPMVFHAFGIAGQIFLPMHIPVLLCGFLCGAAYGGICGVTCVLASSLMTGMPVLYPNGVAMTFELCAYGALSGLLFPRLYKKLPLSAAVYAALLPVMLIGRGIAGAVNALVYPTVGLAFTGKVFLTASFVTGLPGIVLQFILIPVCVAAFGRARMFDTATIRKEAR